MDCFLKNIVFSTFSVFSFHEHQIIILECSGLNNPALKKLCILSICVCVLVVSVCTGAVSRVVCHLNNLQRYAFNFMYIC